MTAQVSEDFRKQVAGFGLTTAQIFYPFPDFRHILTFLVWQEYDQFPDFPRLNRYLDHWRGHVVSPVHSVLVTHSALIQPAELKAIDGEFRLH